MAKNCEKCTEKCPKAEMAHQAALGRMYATKEFTALLKKVESGELVERKRGTWGRHGYCSVCDFWTCYCNEYNFCPHCGAKMDQEG